MIEITELQAYMKESREREQSYQEQVRILRAENEQLLAELKSWRSKAIMRQNRIDALEARLD